MSYGGGAKIGSLRDDGAGLPGLEAPHKHGVHVDKVGGDPAAGICVWRAQHHAHEVHVALGCGSHQAATCGFGVSGFGSLHALDVDGTVGVGQLIGGLDGARLLHVGGGQLPGGGAGDLYKVGQLKGGVKDEREVVGGGVVVVVM